MAYKRPLLRELIAEVSLAPGSLPEASFLSLANCLTASGLSIPEFRSFTSLSVIDPLLPPQARQGPRLKLWNQEKSKLVQYSPDEFFLHLIGPYLGWDAFLDLQALAEDAVLSSVSAPLDIKAVSLIALDEMKVEKSSFTLGEYLHCGSKFVPSWYGNSTEAVDISLGRGLLESDGYNTSVQIAVRPDSSDLVSIELQSSFRILVSPGHGLRDTLELLHSKSLEAFEEMITDKTRDQIMGGRT